MGTLRKPGTKSGRADRSGSLKSARKAKKQAQGEPDSVHRGTHVHRESPVELPPEQRVQREGKELKGKKSQLEAKFDLLWKSVVSKYADPESLQLVEEHPFAKEVGRRFRFDRCHMTQRVAVEIMGGTWSGGRHTSPQGYEKDCEKLLIASELQWQVIYLTSTMITEEHLKRVADIIIARNIIHGPNHDWVITHTVENRGAKH